MTEVRCITINTDASFHPDHKVGGYAFTIVCDQFRVKKSGRFKIQPQTPEEAEIMCIGNAIAMLINMKDCPKSKWLVINSDCTHGMRRIEKKETELAKKVSELYSKLIAKIGSKKNEMRHVRAHTSKDDKRSKVNEWCDTEAKKWMRFELELTKKTKQPA